MGERFIDSPLVVRRFRRIYGGEEGVDVSPVILSEVGWVGVKRKNLKMRNTWHRPGFSHFEILSPSTRLRMTGVDALP
jgi:hypothetical protein